jgi:hypothetical protein
MVQDNILEADSHSACQQAESSSPHNSYLCKVQLNIKFLPTHMSSQWSLTFELPHQNPEDTSPLLHACHMSRPTQSP